jgi:hypothetical protein
MKFVEWQQQVIREAKERNIELRLPKNLRWYLMKRDYFDCDYSPEDAIEEEMERQGITPTA